jgi:hypothetical protein
MSKEKKQAASFNDFYADDNLINEDEIVDNEDQLDSDEELEDKAQEPKKKAVKKQPKQKVELETEDEDPDDQLADEDLEEIKDKKPKKEKKAPVQKIEEPEEEEVIEEEEEETPDALAFFEEVEKITGAAVEVEYGDTDPLSPQGIALRDKALKEQALDTFLEEIEEKFPQAFKVLQHAYNGGDISELFTQTTGRDYSKIELKEGDDATAKQVLTEYFKSKGIKSEQRINKLIESYEDSEEGLFKEAEAALDELKKEQDSQTAKIVEAQKAKAAEQKKKDQILITAVDEVLESRKLGSFKITDKSDASEFKKFVLSSLRRTEGGYEIATAVNPAELEKQLQYAYFQFKKGDLGKIIQQKAATENAKKLSLRLQSEQSKTKKSTQQENKTGLAIKDYYID